ncbi:acyltransferase [uncultured Paraglaciecola sp.]|uniref:acyltransferase family protein n=1 Tax=uncultured Paraglaciecola sp. TaxID=1765024 RepID=UPI002599B4D4|nr:acyltransferase [uncultured Paraglaciecola sp.]
MIHKEISDKQFQMDSLDGLRGFAALIVVFSHTSNQGAFFLPLLDLSGVGKSGVYLFFLLSSFLLTLPLLRKGKEIFTFPVMSHYWQRRFFRIYPLYTLYLLLGVVSTWFLVTFIGKSGRGIPFELTWFEFLKHLALLEGKGVTWSIAVEFKFYFILPILILVIVYIRQLGTAATVSLFTFLMIASQIISPQSESLTNDARLLPYMPVFIIGIFIAVLHEHINKNKPNHKVMMTLKWLGFIGVIGVIIMTPVIYSKITGVSVPKNFFHKQFIAYSIFWSFIILSAVNIDGIIQKLFSIKILRFYGTLSFSLYLFHPVYISLLMRLNLNSYLAAWLVLVSSTITAYLTFVILEKPISRYKLKFKSDPSQVKL